MTAPILILVYNRKKHFINCVESLLKCKLADQTHLFIASDAAKTETDIQAVKEIREYCSNISGFNKVDFLFSNKNMGTLESYFNAVNRVFSEYDRLIFTEDDNVFSTNFLEYMNSALDYYNKNPKVFSICGYKHPFKTPNFYFHDIFASHVVSAWGYGLWKEKYSSVDFYPKSISVTLKQISKMPKLWNHLLNDAINNNKVYGDVLMEYHCLINNLINIFPSISLVQNHGNDGSGKHCVDSPKYANQEICTNNKRFKFKKNIRINNSLQKRINYAIDYPFILFKNNYFHELKKSIKSILKIKK